MGLMRARQICAICADQYSQFADLFPPSPSCQSELVASNKSSCKYRILDWLWIPVVLQIWCTNINHSLQSIQRLMREDLICFEKFLTKPCIQFQMKITKPLSYKLWKEVPEFFQETDKTVINKNLLADCFFYPFTIWVSDIGFLCLSVTP